MTTLSGPDGSPGAGPDGAVPDVESEPEDELDAGDEAGDGCDGEGLCDEQDDADDYRRRPRRRGAELRTAIYRATLDELTEHGYAELTMDRVAARAKASKGSLYRRWGGRAELVVDAIKYLQSSYPVPPETGDLRGELLALFHTIAESMAGPQGEAVRGLMAEIARNPELARTVRTELLDSALPPMLEVLRRGVVRHEVRPGALIPLVARVGPSLIRQQLLMFGQIESPEGFLEEVVDQVVLPLVIAHPPGVTNTGER